MQSGKCKSVEALRFVFFISGFPIGVGNDTGGFGGMNIEYRISNREMSNFEVPNGIGSGELLESGD